MMNSNTYGLTPMSFDEEVNAPRSVKKTRNNKVNAIDKIRLAKRALDSLDNYVQRIPELDDEDHAEKVDTFVEKVMAACDGIWDSIREQNN